MYLGVRNCVGRKNVNITLWYEYKYVVYAIHPCGIVLSTGRCPAGVFVHMFGGILYLRLQYIRTFVLSKYILRPQEYTQQ